MNAFFLSYFYFFCLHQFTAGPFGPRAQHRIAVRKSKEKAAQRFGDCGKMGESERSELNRDVSRIRRDIIIDFTAGMNGGIAHVYTGQPLDTIKVKMQTFPKQYSNMLQCLFETFKKEGIRRGLYAGTTPSLVASAVDNSICFAYYGIMQKAVAETANKSVRDLKPIECALSGAATGVLSALFLCPIELVKCRLQATRELLESGALKVSQVEKGPLRVIRGIWMRDGARGFFRGLIPTLWREAPGNFCFFGVYEATRELLTPAGVTRDELGVFHTGLAGGVSGVVLSLVGFPFDAAKSKIQIDWTPLQRAPSMVGVLRQMVRQNGLLSLYHGVLPSVIRAFPGTGALFIAVEHTRKFLPALFD